MTDRVPSEDIGRIVGVERHPTRHYARAVSTEETVYILHSQMCRDTYPDLRDCPFSLVLDNGIDVWEWGPHMDTAVRVSINQGYRLIPAVL